MARAGVAAEFWLGRMMCLNTSPWQGKPTNVSFALLAHTGWHQPTVTCHRPRAELWPHCLVPKTCYVRPWLAPSAAVAVTPAETPCPARSPITTAGSRQECCGSPGDLTPGMVEDEEGSARCGAHEHSCLCPHSASPVSLGMTEGSATRYRLRYLDTGLFGESCFVLRADPQGDRAQLLPLVAQAPGLLWLLLWQVLSPLIRARPADGL